MEVVRTAALLALLLAGSGACQPANPPLGAANDGAPASGTARVEVPMKTHVMISPLAGRWFPADAAELRKTIGELMPSPRPAVISNVCAVLVPHAGYPYSGRVACQVYARLDAAAYDRVVVLGLTHSTPMRNVVSIPDASELETPLGRVAVDTALVAALRQSPRVTCIPRAHAQEHSDQIQVPLLQHVFGNRLKIVTLVVGQMEPSASRAFADALRPLLDRRTLVVASSDFTHYGPNYGYVPFTTNVPAQLDALDHKVFARIAAVDGEGFRAVLADTGATVCGHDPIGVLLDLLPRSARITEVAYDTSGRQLNDWENSVSYLGAVCVADWEKARAEASTAAPPAASAAATGTVTAAPVAAEESGALDAEDRAQLLKLARATLEHAVRTGKVPAVEATGVTIRPGMKQTMGGFVTLNIRHELRGCIGEIFPRRAIWKVVQEQAVNAALHDPRFAPVTAAELAAIVIDISALTPPKPVASYRDIVIGKHGMTLAKQGRSAVFLPQVAPEQGWDLATTLTHLARKAGLPGDAWKEGCEFTVFEAQVFSEK